MNEIQVNTILKRAKNLQQVLEEPLAKKVLEIDLDADSAKNRTLLARLIKSLDQYVNKERSLIYIGFVGHYSSGKSSTINSLLNLNDTNDRRNTGLNPTDKAITLITNTKNSNALILMNRESGSVPVRTTFLHNTLLNNLVIADTPGSGDPHVVNEMIQDFLPICDYILYFISSTNPLDQADLPLLGQKAQKLPFIPLIFIITRADEFRTEKAQPVNSQNIDHLKKDQFTGQLLSRIKELLKTDEITLDNFIFIDNEFDYNVDELRNQITIWSTLNDNENLLKIHGYKVEYYRTNLDAIFSFFLTAIDDKIKKSREFLRQANENITRFDRSIELNNEKLKLLWSKGDSNFNQTHLNELKNLEDIIQLRTSSNLSYDKDLQNVRKQIYQSIDSQINGYVGKIVLDLNNHFKQKIREIKHNVYKEVESGDIMKENLNSLFPGRLELGSIYETMEIDFSKLIENSNLYADNTARVLNDTKNTLRAKLHQISSFVARESIIRSIQEQYEQGRNTISENFDQYFERIHLYRNTVLSRNNKEIIEKLRVGTQLDELDDEFSEDFVSEMKNRAVSEIYFSNERNVAELKSTLTKGQSQIVSIREEIDGIKSSKEEVNTGLVKEKVSMLEFVTTLIRQSEEIINTEYQKRLNEVAEQHKINYGHYVNSKSEITTRRRKVLIKWSLTLGFIALLSYLGLRFFNVIKPSTITMDVLIALLTTAIGNLIGYFLIMLRTDIKNLIEAKKSEIIRLEKSEILQLFGEDFWDDISARVTESRSNINTSFLKSVFAKKMDPILLEIHNRDQLILDQLNHVNREIDEKIQELIVQLNLFYNKHAIIFQEPQENIDKIALITKQVRETAIKPSFDLLNETTENLEKVKSKIQIY